MPQKLKTILIVAVALTLIAAIPAGAARLITGKQVKNSTLTGTDVKNSTLTGAEPATHDPTSAPTGANTHPAALAKLAP